MKELIWWALLENHSGYEDDDGNEYAHREDIHTLTNGTTCHADNADELQKEIDDADKEDDAQAETIKQQLQGQQPNENN